MRSSRGRRHRANPARRRRAREHDADRARQVGVTLYQNPLPTCSNPSQPRIHDTGSGGGSRARSAARRGRRTATRGRTPGASGRRRAARAGGARRARRGRPRPRAASPPPGRQRRRPRSPAARACRGCTWWTSRGRPRPRQDQPSARPAASLPATASSRRAVVGAGLGRRSGGPLQQHQREQRQGDGGHIGDRHVRVGDVERRHREEQRRQKAGRAAVGHPAETVHEVHGRRAHAPRRAGGRAGSTAKGRRPKRSARAGPRCRAATTPAPPARTALPSGRSRTTDREELGVQVPRAAAAALGTTVLSSALTKL